MSAGGRQIQTEGTDGQKWIQDLSRPGWALEQLEDGTPRQRRAFLLLEEGGLLKRLAAYSPLLVGTIPIDVDVETSDLDLLCVAADLDRFESDIRSHFGRAHAFTTWRRSLDGLPSQVARFKIGGFEIEIFGQDRIHREQLGFLHLVAEARLLAEAGEGARQDIRRLKVNQWKTEPAFCVVFYLPGDPYQTLAELATAELGRVIEIVRRASCWRSQADGAWRPAAGSWRFNGAAST